MLSLILVMGLAAGEPAAAGEADAARSAAQRDKEVVCVSITPTGSVIAQRVCKTRKAWRKIEEAQKRQADRALESAGQTRARE